MATCRITPLVKNDKGEMVYSKLHSDLSFFFRDKKVHNNVWDLAHKGLLKNTGNSAVERDENGEPTYGYILGSTEAARLVTDEEVADGLNIIRATMDNNFVGTQGAKRAAREASLHNSNSPLAGRVVAEVDINTANNVSKVRYSAINEENSARATQLIRGNTLTDKLEGWLMKHGIAVGTLTEAEEGSGIEGVSDFTSTRRTADGLREIIRVARGEAGRVAITEEAAHVAVMALNGKDASVTRALTLLKDNADLVRAVLGDKYETYKERYGGDSMKIAHEAAGHILRDQLVEEHSRTDDTFVSKFSILWTKMKNAVLGFFKKFTTTEIDVMLAEAREGLHDTARKILDDSFYEELDFSAELEGIDKLFAISEKEAKRLDDMAERIIADTTSRMRLIPAFMRKTKKGKAAGRFFRLRKLKEGLESKHKSHKDLEVMYDYLKNASNDMYYQLSTFRERYDKARQENKPYVILNIYNLINVYESVLADAMAVVESLKETSLNDSYAREFIVKLEEVFNGYKEGEEYIPGLSTLLTQTSAKIQRYMMPTFISFASKYVPIDNIIVPKGGRAYGKSGGETITLEDQMMRSPEVGTIDKWFLPAALSNSMPVQVFQRIMNLTQLEVRDMTLEYKKRLQELALRLEKAGFENQDWMFERDSKGGLTGEYVKPDSIEYANLTQEQKEFYKAVLDIKRELDGMLPMELRHLFNAPKIRKDFLEQLQRKDKASWQSVKDYMSEAWSFKSDDEYTLEKDHLFIDYNNNVLRMVPIRFLAFAANEDKQNMSLDIVSTMTRYAQMCCNYTKMTRIMPALELGRDLLKLGYSENMKVYRDKNGEQQRDLILGEMRGKNQEDNTMSRINDIMESGYGFKVENVTTTILGKHISLTAVGHRLMALTAANQYMLSVNAAVQNAISAQLQFLGGVAGSKFYDRNDYVWAQSIYAQNIPQLMSDITKRVPDSKISLFCEKFNVMMSDENHPFNRKAGRLLDPQNMYFMTTMGEFHANSVISLAIAHRYKLKDKDGKDINLWDALEVVDMAEKKLRDAKKMRERGDIVEAEALEEKVDKHPEWKNSQNKYLVLKDGVTKPDGTEITDDDFHVATRRMMHVSHVLNGVYNIEDAAKWQRYIGGQILGMYRKWIAPSWHRRVNKLSYSLDDGSWGEGFYRTFWRINAMRIKALYDKTVAAQIKGNKLEEWEIKNLNMAYFEIGLCVSFIACKILLGAYKSKHRSYAWNSMYYYVVRTSSELNSLNPIGMINESVRILKSPTACLSTLNNLTGLVGCMMNPYTWGFTDNAYVDRGKYKGMTKLERAVLKSPFLPGSHQMLAFLYPEDAVKFYE